MRHVTPIPCTVVVVGVVGVAKVVLVVVVVGRSGMRRIFSNEIPSSSILCFSCQKWAWLKFWSKFYHIDPGLIHYILRNLLHNSQNRKARSFEPTKHLGPSIKHWQNHPNALDIRKTPRSNTWSHHSFCNPQQMWKMAGRSSLNGFLCGKKRLLFSTLLYSLLYSTVLYSSLLYSTLLYSTLLYDSLLLFSLMFKTP